MLTPALHPAALTPICPGCGCSLVRLKVKRDRAASLVHNGEEHLFCCEGCVEVFRESPDRFLEEIHDVVVCPGCLAEKHISQTVELEHEGAVVRLCRCPHCAEAFKRDPNRLLQRVAF
jgi:YHS domain-containing protein